MNTISISFKEKLSQFVDRERKIIESDFKQKTESFISLSFSKAVSVPLKSSRSSDPFFVEDLIKTLK